MTRILVVGDVVDDLVVRPLTDVTAASDTNAEIRRTDGGSAANVAAWLGHLGADVRFVGRAGTDGAQRHAAALAAYGVDARVSADPDLPTATLVATLDPSGDRTMYVDRAANERLSAADLPDDVLDGVGWLHVTGYSLFDDGVRPTVLDLVARARTRARGVSSTRARSASSPAAAPRRSSTGWPASTWSCPTSPKVASSPVSRSPARCSPSLAERFPGVVLTLGVDGASYAGDGSDRPRRRPAGRGAGHDRAPGDAFCAGFLSTWTSDRDAAAALEAGAAAAARLVTRVGARP